MAAMALTTNTETDLIVQPLEDRTPTQSLNFVHFREFDFDIDDCVQEKEMSVVFSGARQASLSGPGIQSELNEAIEVGFRKYDSPEFFPC